jgi:hypothetical protein
MFNTLDSVVFNISASMRVVHLARAAIVFGMLDGICRGSRQPFPGDDGSRGSVQLISPGWMSAGCGGGSSVNSSRERVITSVMSQSIVFKRKRAVTRRREHNTTKARSPERAGFYMKLPGTLY